MGSTIPDKNPLNSQRAIDLGDVAPGVTGTVVLTRTIDANRTQNIQPAKLDVTVSDRTHDPFDWRWFQHDLDVSLPEVQVLSPETYVPLGPLEFQDTVESSVEVKDVQLIIRPG